MVATDAPFSVSSGGSTGSAAHALDQRPQGSGDGRSTGTAAATADGGLDHRGSVTRPTVDVDVAASRRPGRSVLRKVEATIGFEPMHRGFADPPLNRLGTSPWGPDGGAIGRNWLALEDSNLGSRIQSPLSYH